MSREHPPSRSPVEGPAVRIVALALLAFWIMVGLGLGFATGVL